ncbi:MAG: apbE 1 [Bacteroidetes bacterium]|nr:apbE 1 [Bacteroidota bacterium]
MAEGASEGKDGRGEGSGFLRFQHRAMATMFEVMTAGEEPGFAGGAARAAFEEIDRIEQELSRYSPNSDIARINNLEPHGSVRVGLETFQCLKLSLMYWEETGGAFDVTLGALMECWVAKDKSLLRPTPDEVARAVGRTGMRSLALDEASMSVSIGAAVPLIDLGAVGKGYAVDRAVELLKEWGVGSALVHGGTSSVFAFGKLGGEPGWPVTLSDPDRTTEVIERVILADSGLGGSGIKKGRHIIDPRTAAPVDGRRAAWVISESAARSDALSTACMVMTEKEIRAMVSRDGRLRAALVGGNTGNPVRFGGWSTA